MEIMEEGNLMDRVRILLQRDLGYYQDHQTVLQENLCPGVVGGLLDFPFYASFAAVKLVLWWEEAYIAAFRKPSGLLEHHGGSPDVVGEVHDEDTGPAEVVTTSAPQEFLELSSSSASQLLDHLHTLTQEALDHADLTVLTGTLGAAALIKNCLWCYNEQLKKQGEDARQNVVLSLHKSYKQFHEMSEALAERLLDLHCRLLSLYVLQDADCLDWEDPRPFFEGERGSFVIQMWWLYMQGTREDLWNTVPPKTAQRVLAGMLNESLTILTVRYTQAKPSSGRSSLLVTDISNLLLCVRELLPAISNDAEELTGHATRNKVLRDVHAKCHELFTCMIIRGCPLSILYKVFRKGLGGLPVFSQRDQSSPSPWFVLTSPHLFPSNTSNIRKLPDGPAIALELSVLVAQPQASWTLLLKVLMMRNSKVACLLLNHLMQQLGKEVPKSAATKNKKDKEKEAEEKIEGHCGGFLCPGGGECSLGNASEQVLASSVTIEALIYIVAMVGGPKDLARVLLPSLERSSTWGGCLDRRQVWNQSRPPWLEAILRPLEDGLTPVVQTLQSAVQAGATLDQATSLALDCLCHLADCLPPSVLRAAALLEDAIPADVHPMAGSVLLQLLISGLYSQLIVNGENTDTALCEALCGIDQNSRHAEKIQAFLQIVKECVVVPSEEYSAIEGVPHMAEVLVSSVLLTAAGRRALKVMWQYIQHSHHWILGQLDVLEAGETAPILPPPIPATASRPAPTKLLHTMFHVGHRHFDQLLAGSWELDWSSLLQTPLALTPERLWTQLSWRSEFQEPKELLSEHDRTVVSTLSTLFDPHPETPATQN
ncbi:uncharacterized protein KIAA0825 [Anabrus simplex]|uniref:uncharacterized protein KIAA0825 n=1 Tax=Anabrus simplex TaxID=316456 RepID=UPI0035A29C22